MSSASDPDLYPALVGPGWATLPAAVRAVHSVTGVAPARGVVTVRRGQSLVARLVGLLLGLPAAGEGVPAELHVTAHAHGQRWARRFGGVPMVTDQAAHQGALLEFVGPFALAFRLMVDGGALVFTQAPTRLGRPGWMIPWPAFLAPRITGRCAGSGAATAHVNVVIAHPIVGLLVSYEGVFTVSQGVA
ncbi:MAG: DUF4166 domain-containing protein [Pseudomonadota bacterium]|nr:DUF4166 domain-containing protein [Pseudomonadota bacterium]